MTASTSNSVVQEMKAVFEAIDGGSIGAKPLKVTTKSGRKYEVCYARETSPGEWASTEGARSRGHFLCPNCKTDSALGIPGGDWLQITLKNGAASEPVVRLFEIMHSFKLHPETLNELATNEKCARVFGAACQPALVFDLAAMQKKAEAYVTLNRFKSPGVDFRYVYPKDLKTLNDLIEKILLDAQFQSNPKEYLDEWDQKRGHKEWTGVMHDDAARYFFDHHFEYMLYRI